MTRTYIVIPEGTPVWVVDAATPHYAANKTRRGLSTVESLGLQVVPMSASVNPKQPTAVIPGQLTIEEAHE